MSDAALFVPDAYRAADPGALVRAYPFALLTTAGAAGIHATATPIFFEDEGDESRLIGHIARRNPHAATLTAGQQALAVFSGPSAYISARWYAAKPEVPTWNYVAAHVRGTLEPIDDDAGQLAVLVKSAARLEAGAAPPWTLEQAPDGRVAFLLPMIRSFRIHVERLEGVTKLSQTHPAADRDRVIAALGDHPVARLMATLAQ